MNKSIKFIIGVILLASFLLTASACGGSTTTTSSSPTTTSAGATTNAGTSGSTAGGTATVDLSNTQFNPSTLTVVKGTTVTWSNDDPFSHTVTSSSGAFDSGTLKADGTYSYTFTTAGTYEYACTIHPSMKGTIIVTNS